MALYIQNNLILYKTVGFYKLCKIRHQFIYFRIREQIMFFVCLNYRHNNNKMPAYCVKWIFMKVLVNILHDSILLKGEVCKMKCSEHMI